MRPHFCNASTKLDFPSRSYMPFCIVVILRLRWKLVLSLISEILRDRGYNILFYTPLQDDSKILLDGFKISVTVVLATRKPQGD